MSCLALFDLDHTLIPIDSDYEWGRYLGQIGAVDPVEYEARNLRYYEDYQAGTLAIDEYLAFSLEPLANNEMTVLHDWHRRFMADVVQPVLHQQARDLVQRHLDRGDLVAVVTATNDFVTAPIVQTLGVEHLIATRAEQRDGRYTGRVDGLPSFREGKITRVDEWLASLGRQLGDFERSWFYSDSANDLPLLERVTDPVATNPDSTLRARATAQGWPIIELFA